MKRLRQYRISITKMDLIVVKLSFDGKELVQDEDFELVNISGSGLGVSFTTYHSIEGIIQISLRVGTILVESRGRVTREKFSRNHEGQVYLGIELLDADEFLMQNLLMSLIESMNSKRLKELLMDMIYNEGHALNDELSKLSVSAPILIDLFHLFQKYNSSYKMINLFAQEVKRCIGADSFRFYTFENDGRDISLFDFDVGKATSSLLPVVGKLKGVKDSGHIYSSRLSKTNSKDEFYNLLQTLYDVKIDTYILSPVIDKAGHMIGIIEFSNKDNYELFSMRDTNRVNILSTILGLTFSFNLEIDSFDYAKKIVKRADDGYLIGTSEESRYLNSFVDNVAKTNEPVLVVGEYGVGKKIVASNIHAKSSIHQYGIGHVNSHDFYDVKSLEQSLLSDEFHVGMLELYSGGTVVFKDINFLSHELQESLFKIITVRTDIRFMATSTETIDALKYNANIYWPLFNFFAKNQIRVPALRERKDDILPLAYYFTYKLCEQNTFAPKNISAEVLNHFQNYDWPGNINELKIAIERLIIFGHDLKSLTYKKSRILPILDRDLDADFTYGLDLSHDLFGQTQITNKDDFESLYFYYYVDSLISSMDLETFEISGFFSMNDDEFYQKLYIAHQLSYEYFEQYSEVIENYLSVKAA